MSIDQPFIVRIGEEYELTLSEDERALLESVPRRLEQALARITADTVEVPTELRRLFPIAFASDEQAERAFVQRSRTELAEHHRRALEVLARTSSATHLSEDELTAWLEALNILRLVFGNALEVSEETEELARDDPSYGEWLLYRYLTYLEAEIVEMLAAELPPPIPGADETLPDDPWGDPPGDLRWDGTPVPPA